MMLFLVLYIIFNAISMLFITYEGFENDNLFIYPGLIEHLRDDLNIPGTVIVATVFSILLAPAIICYFVFIGAVTCLFLLCELFKFLFRRRD